jgi:hypothetical protein
MVGYQLDMEVFAAVAKRCNTSTPFAQTHTFKPQAGPPMFGFRPCPYLSAKPAAQRSIKRYLNLQFS